MELQLTETTKTDGIQISSIRFIVILHITVVRNITVQELGGGKQRRTSRTPPPSAMSAAAVIATPTMPAIATVALPRLSVPAKVQNCIFNKAALRRRYKFNFYKEMG